MADTVASSSDSCDHHLATPDIDTASEDTETSCNEFRVKLGKRHCDKVFQC